MPNTGLAKYQIGLNSVVYRQVKYVLCLEERYTSSNALLLPLSLFTQLM